MRKFIIVPHQGSTWGWTAPFTVAEVDVYAPGRWTLIRKVSSHFTKLQAIKGAQNARRELATQKGVLDGGFV